MTRREQQLSSLIRSLVATWIERNDIAPDNSLVTITHTNVSPGRAHAQVLVSVLPDGAKHKAMNNLKRQLPRIQKYVNSRIASRPVPRISFEYDTDPIESERLERLINESKR